MYAYTLALTLTLGQTLNDESYRKIRDEVVPTREELKWLDVPWQPTLWSALVQAQKEDKPILMYAMNGHPLGCV